MATPYVAQLGKGHIDVVKQLAKRTISQARFDQAMQSAENNGHQKVAAFLESHRDTLVHPQKRDLRLSDCAIL